MNVEQERTNTAQNTEIVDLSEQAGANINPTTNPANNRSNNPINITTTAPTAPIPAVSVAAPIEPPEDLSKAPITLKLKDQDGGFMIFKVKMGTPLKKIMSAFAERKGVDCHILRFNYDGQRVDQHHTPKMLEMQQMDEIQVFLPAHGGNKK